MKPADRFLPRLPRFLSNSAIWCGLLAAATLPVHADSGVWIDPAGGLWSDDGNWSGGTIANGADFLADFNVNITAATTITLDSARTIGSIRFADSANAAGTQTWLLSNNGNILNTLTLSGASSLISVPHDTVNSLFGRSVTIQPNLILATNSRISLGPFNGTFTVNGNIDLGSNEFRFSTNSSAAIVINGQISGAGGIRKDSTGNLTLAQGNLHTGTNTLNRGTVLLGADTALGSGTVALNIDTDQVLILRSNNTTDRIIGNALTFSTGTGQKFEIGHTNGGNMTFTSTAAKSITNNKSFVVRSRAEFAGGFTGAGGITKAGAGVLVLGGTNNYSGATVVGATISNVYSAGTLLVNGTLSNSAVTVNNLGTLGGGGTLGGTVTVNAGGTLSPGESPGLMTVSNNLTLNTDSAFTFELTGNTIAGRGTNYDAVDVTGTGILSIQPDVTANLVFNLDESTVDFTSSFWDSNQSWLVFDNANAGTYASASIFDSITTTLDAFDNDFSVTGGTLSFSTVGNDVYLNYVIPEPSTAAVFCLGLGALLAGRRGRRAGK